VSSEIRRYSLSILSVLLGIVLATPAQAQTVVRVSPNAIWANSGEFTLLVDGSGFDKSMSVYLNFLQLQTTFVSSTRLEASAPSLGPCECRLTVRNSTASSSGTPFLISVKPVLSIVAIIPDSVAAGGQEFTLTVQGTHFSHLSVLQWNGVDKLTDCFNDSALSAKISAADIRYPGMAEISVVDSGIDEQTSNTMRLPVRAAGPPPSILSLSPPEAEVGSAGLILAISGAHFSPTSLVQWNGSIRETQFADAGTLYATLLDTDLQKAGQAVVTVLESAPGGKVSAPAQFVIQATPSVMFPQLAVGAGYSTALTLLNTGDAQADGTLKITDDSGVPLPVNVIGSNKTQVSGSDVAVTIAPGASRILTLSGLQAGGTPKTGWVRVDSSGGPLRGVASLSYSEGGALKYFSTAPNADPMQCAAILLDDDSAVTRFSGFSVVNYGTVAMTLKLAVFDEDGILVTVLSPPELNPMQPQVQLTRFVQEYVPGLGAAFKGSLVLISTDGKSFVAGGLMMQQGLLSLLPAFSTACPVLP
jgi:hypothetical protein